jgi:ABC-type multidrug transport system fused ATPase/permease subunit
MVVDQGTIIEEGSHDDLIGRGGFYAHLHGLQDGRSVASPAG